MRNFPLPLRFSIPAVLILCGGLMGIISFNREVSEAYIKTEINTKNYVQISAGQTSRILDYLYRRSNIEDADITIISQLGSDPNLNLVMLIDDRNIIHLSNRYELQDTPISNSVAATYNAEFVAARKKLSGKVLFAENKQKLIAIYPIFLQVLTNEIRPSRLGILFFEYDLKRDKQHAYSDALKRSLIFNGSLIIFCLGLWFFFELTLTRRISQLVAASNSLAEGNFNVRTRLSGSDELVQVSVAFDRMANKIQENTQILQEELIKRESIEAKLTEINEQLAVSNIQLASATKAKSEFLANMSHEIRTPMNGIIGMIQLLCETNLTEEQKDFVYTIRDSGNSLLTIINDILNFSKIESGNLQLEAHPFKLKDIIKSVCNLLSTQTDIKKINMQYSIDPHIPVYLLGDGSRLRQVLLNLIGNAIKFTPAGGVYLSANSQLIADDQECTQYQLMISIKDTGIGIDGDRLQKLFQPFTQADASISRKYGGTGLGLAISKSLVNLMGGRIWVESLGNIAGNPPDDWIANKNNYHQGSIFHFTFIAKAVLSCELIPKDSSQPPQTKDIKYLSPLKILLAEDNLVNQKVAIFTLKKLGYIADIANNGLEVLAMLENQFYDIILMDMQMPEMDGVTATKIIRQSSQNQPYIIALTANALEADHQLCLDAGMNKFITKPIVIEEISRVLSEYSQIHS
ncbi:MULTISPECIES: ATP-binding protein [Aphanizomenon]|jgi:signal transduction histidine kinase/CheY-like chemotaxis protein|uniref:histidine kinase n=1 Tax=Aphanizomenon flos-aquae FACHB-1249 TaxID=2692889 RepID=A0ABR8INB2_APHFL|nr:MULTISPECIES: ATP-binding protein [Aphanizomenon]MBD2391020.1 response regulator [Aphanizomenon flos-aquae FACHB-1171]MBD2558378.1 response regulator [Aphanizomenon flos-aquae FACHB-1290]MBD2630799.1 response regulator [Aphanizomenon sp. FACHB-1399]MBD2641745.1 response regulator [Aphanizomenon sp. FACHB-1401]MBD2656120.1 response regulator [Aphanizomenon flos-aquae FACHB-1265]